jgi:hypothetical protein
VVRFSAQVKRYLDVFGRQNVHVIIFEEFKNRTDKIYRNVLRFLAVDDNYAPDFDVKNVSKSAYISGINRFLFSKDPTPLMSKIIKKISSQNIRQKIRKMIIRLNTYPYQRKPLDASLQKKLLMEFEPEIRSLSEVIERDLAAWMYHSD